MKMFNIEKNETFLFFYLFFKASHKIYLSQKVSTIYLLPSPCAGCFPNALLIWNLRHCKFPW